MKDFFFKRKRKARLDDALRKVPMFSGLTKRQTDKLAKRAYVRYYKDGETVFYRDEPAYGLFIVLKGGVEVRRGKKVLSSYAPFHAFGEFALLKEATRSADAKTKGETTLCYLFKEDLNKIFLSDPKLCVTIYQNLLASAVDTLKRAS